MAEEPQVVVFREDDYATFARRVGSFLIDLVLIVAVVAAATRLIQQHYAPAAALKLPIASPERKRLIDASVQSIQTPDYLGFLGFVIAYHAGMRRLAGGTIGYRLMGLRLVDETGKLPAWKPSVKRFFVAFAIVFGAVFCVSLLAKALEGILPYAAKIVGPASLLLFVIAYLPCRSRPRRQSVHDQWAGTWVVRRPAAPAGPGRLAYVPHFIGPFMFAYSDLEPIAPEGGSAAGEPRHAASHR